MLQACFGSCLALGCAAATGELWEGIAIMRGAYGEELGKTFVFYAACLLSGTHHHPNSNHQHTPCESLPSPPLPFHSGIPSGFFFSSARCRSRCLTALLALCSSDGILWGPRGPVPPVCVSESQGRWQC